MKHLLTSFFCLHLLAALAQPQAYPDLALQQILDSAEFLQESSRQNEVKNLLSEASKRLDSSSPKELWFIYYHTKGSNLFEARNIPESKEAFKKALKVAEQLNDSSKLGVAYTSIANTENISSNFQTSIELFEKALSYFTQDDKDNYYATLMNMSTAYSGLNEFQKALSSLLITKEYFLKTNDHNRLGIIENNLGEIYRRNIQDFNKARAHYRWAVVANQKANNLPGLAKNYHNISAAFLDENKTDSAIYYTRKSIEIKEQIGDEGGMASANYLMGSTFARLGQYSKAIEYHNLSMEQCKRNGLQQGIFYNLISLGEAYFSLGDFAKSEDMLRQSLIIAEESGELSMLQNVYTGLYELNKASGDNADALLYFEKKQEVVDSIQLIQEKQHVVELRTQYEADLAEADNMILREKEKAQNQKLEGQQNLLSLAVASIILLLIAGLWLAKSLGQRNRAYVREKESSDALANQFQKLKESEAELAESNDLKNKILSVLGHDLRSPLAGISSLLSTMSALEITREELQDLLGHLKKEVDVSLTALNEILIWARLQMNEMTKLIENLDAKELVNEVVSIYEPNIRAKHLNIELNIPSDIELWADNNQMRSICGNLLSNAIKFTPEKGKIKISVTDNFEFTEITFCDSGLGIPEDVLENLNDRNALISKSGTSGESGTGIGLRIVTDFVDAHNGVLHFKNNADRGTTVSVKIPKPDIKIRQTG